MATFIIIIELITAVFLLYVLWYILYIPKALRSDDNLVLSTINHFNLNNRGINDEGKCTFVDGCAIGRFLPKLICKQLDTSANKYHSLADDFRTWRFRKISINCRVFTQVLHDREMYWDYMGLSIEGIHKIKHSKYGHLLQK